MFEFFPVIEKSDCTEYECKCKNKQMDQPSLSDGRKTGCDACDQYSKYEHHTAHGRRSALFIVPVRSYELDLLTEFLLYKPRYIYLSECVGAHERNAE